MTFYHGSPIGNLKELIPTLSEHGKPYVYFATNPLVALLYAVKPVPKPFSFYPYGFDSDGTVVYSEYFPDAFKTLYAGKVGYLYECAHVLNAEQPTQINCAYTCASKVEIDKMTVIEDLYEYFIEKESLGLFRIKRFENVSVKEMSFVLDDLVETIEKYGLKNAPDNPMSVFIKEYFPNLQW